MKKILLTITLLSSVSLAFGQSNDGLFITLREDLIDFSMPINSNLNPTRTSVSHIFGTELSAGYRLDLSRQWTVGVSAGLMLHDYAWTNTFASQPASTGTYDDGSTRTTYVTHSGQTTLNLPLLLTARFRFADWADRQMWDVVPLLSTRIGYVVGLTSIKSEHYEEEHWVASPLVEEGSSIDRRNYTFDKQGFYFALGIGASYRHLDLELEYTIQPNHYIGTHYQQFTDADGTTTESTQGPDRYAFAAGDGLTLRLTYNF